MLNHIADKPSRHHVVNQANWLGLIVLACMIPLSPLVAEQKVSAFNHDCAEDSGGVGSCTANEINIANASRAYTEAEFCLAGADVFVSRIDVNYGLNTGVRYDPLLWIGSLGNDPRDVGGECYVSSAPPDDHLPQDQRIFLDLEGNPGDSCLDISNPVVDEVSVTYWDDFAVKCLDFDNDENNYADVKAVVTWVQNTNLACGDGEGEMFSPGAPPKCDYSLMSLEIPVIPHPEQVTLTLLKAVVGGTAQSTDWTLTATGTEPINTIIIDEEEVEIYVVRSGVQGDEAITSVILPMGDYELSESGGPGGYLASNWDCTDGVLNGNTLTLAGGDNATCTITNTLITNESLTVAKVIESDNGGTATLDDFDISVDGDEIAWSDPGSQIGGSKVVSIQAGTYTLSEADIPGYTEGSWSCLDDDELFVPTTNNGAFGGADVTVSPDQHVTCSITNQDDADPPELTIIKHVINDNGGAAVAANWTMDITATNPSSNNFPGAEAPGVTITIDAGAYSVAESGGPAGYSASFSPGCSGNLAVGESATCTITNDDISPDLTIIKHVVNDNGGTAVASEWTMDVTASNPSSNNFPGSEAPGVMITLNAGAYSVTESGGPGGYDASFSAGCSGSLGLDESAVCTITNDDIPAELTIIKHVINDDGGTNVASDWDMIVTATNPSNNNFPGAEAPGVTITVDAGAYSVDESAGPAGYFKTFNNCAGVLPPGGSATCTITNDDTNKPKLTVIKHVINDDGGDALASDWTMDITAANPSNNNFPGSEAPGVTIVFDAGIYSVTESGGPDGYSASFSAGCSGSLADGEEATCTITNDDIAPTLTLTKLVINDDDGTAGADDFGISVNGNVVLSGATIEYMANMDLVIDEAGLADYDFVSITGDAKCPASLGDSLSLDEGEAVSCTITNDDQPPPGSGFLTIIKNVVNDNGGTAGADDFGLSVNGAPVDSGVTESYTANTPLVINEAGLEGYIFVSITGDAKCPGALGGSVTLDELEEVTCTITNDDSIGSATLTLRKDVINGFGGNRVDTDWTLIANGPVIRSGVEGSDAVTSSTVLPGVYDLSETGPGGYSPGDWSCNGGSLIDSQLTLAENDIATCTITNTEQEPATPQDVSVDKVLLTETYGCPPINGGRVEFLITVENHGFETAAGVLLTDDWNSQLKPAKTPDIYDCTLIKERTVRCKLGNMGASDTIPLSFEYYLEGDADQPACNLASVTSSPAEITDTDNNESEACFSFVGQLGASPSQLPPAQSGIFYNQTINITGGLPDKDIVVTGLEGAISAAIDNEQNRITISGCPSLAQGNTLPLTIDVSYFGEDQESACQTFSKQYTLAIENPQGCGLDKISSVNVQQRATVGGRLSRPDEALQKIIVNRDVPGGEIPERYLVGHIDRNHSYATDPNGQYVDHVQNYDIRVVKYDGSGTLVWDKTYDTGNDDLGYTLTLSADKKRIFVGGMSAVETRSNWRLDATLLEIDAGSGCALGEHFQSAGNATTSAYYNLASDGDNLFAVGEQQGHPAKAGDFGGLVSVFSQQSNLAGQDECADDLIIGETSPGSEALSWRQNIIREAVPGTEDDAVTVAYSIKLPVEGCEPNCATLVGGKSGAHGWVDVLDTEAATMTLSSFALPRDMNVQDIAVRQDYIVIAGSSVTDVTNILKYAADGSESWRATDIGGVKGRLRAVGVDKNGFVYSTGTDSEEDSAGLLIKLDASGNFERLRQIDKDQVSSNSGLATGVSFQGLVVLNPGRGVIIGHFENGRDSSDYDWLLLDFGCEDSCSPPD